MDKHLVINALSPYQHKAVQIPKHWDFKITGNPLIPATGVTMKLYVGGEIIDLELRLGISSIIQGLKGVGLKQFIVEYIFEGKVICTLGCKKVREHIEKKPHHQSIMF